jgi:hypothetical protein
MVLSCHGCCVVMLLHCCCFSLSVTVVVSCGCDQLWLVVAWEGLHGPGSSSRCCRHPVSQRVGLGRTWVTYLDALKYTTTMNNVCCSLLFGCHIANGNVAPGFHFR